MSSLFGDENAKEATQINENGTEENKEAAGEPANIEAAAKRPAWLKQKKGKNFSPFHIPYKISY